MSVCERESECEWSECVRGRENSIRERERVCWRERESVLEREREREREKQIRSDRRGKFRMLSFDLSTKQ